MQKNILIIVTYIFSWVGTFMAVGLMAIILPNLTNQDLNQIAQIALGVVGFLMMIIFFRKYMMKQTTQFREKWFSYIKAGLLTFVLLFAASYISNVILELFEVSGQSENQDGIRSLFDNISTFRLILLIATITIFTPVVEEIAFRKGVYGLFGQLYINFISRYKGDEDTSIGSKSFKYASIFAIVFSGLTFGLLHVFLAGDYEYLITYGSAGMVLGYMYHINDRNIYPTIIGHVLYNGFGVFVMMMM